MTRLDDLLTKPKSSIQSIAAGVRSDALSGLQEATGAAQPVTPVPQVPQTPRLPERPTAPLPFSPPQASVTQGLIAGILGSGGPTQPTGWGSPQGDVASAVWDRTAELQGVDFARVRHQGSAGALTLARSQLGVPYVFGSLDPAGGGSAGIDCSGLTKWVYSKLGIELPHLASSQASMFPKVGRDGLKPGDLVFYEYGRKGYGGPDSVDHVAIYAGNGQQYAASSSAGHVVLQPVDWSHFVWGGATNLGGGGGQGGRSGTGRNTSPRRKPSRTQANTAKQRI